MKQHITEKDLEEMYNRAMEFSDSFPPSIEIDDGFPLSHWLFYVQLAGHPVTFTTKDNTFELRIIK